MVQRYKDNNCLQNPYKISTGGLTPPAGGWGAKEETPLYGMSRMGMLSKTYDKLPVFAYNPVQGVAFEEYVYEVKDHLGNVRATYQGEFAEKDGETDWNSFELRQYDSEIGRWLSVDPMRQHHSPYLAMSNNPVNFIDPTGGVDWWKGSDGKTVWIDNPNDAIGYTWVGGADYSFYGGTLAEATVISPSFSDRVSMFVDQMAMSMRQNDQAFQKTLKDNVGGVGFGINVSGAFLLSNFTFSMGVVGDSQDNYTYFGYSANLSTSAFTIMPTVSVDGGATLYVNSNGKTFDAASQLAGQGYATSVGIGRYAVGASSDKVSGKQDFLGLDKERHFTGISLGIGGGFSNFNAHKMGLGMWQPNSGKSVTISGANNTNVTSFGEVYQKLSNLFK
jgi:RHS repeat-associated protein